MGSYFEEQNKFVELMIEAYQCRKIPNWQSFEPYFKWKISKERLSIVDIFRMKCEALALIDQYNVKHPKERAIIAYLNAINNELTYIILLCHKA